MTLVILGTQDKSFERLLKMVEKAVKNGIIKDEVIVQSGQTKYKSNCMQIIDLIPMYKFNKLINEANIVITHGGVGSIITSLKHDKKVIAIPRLSKYKEHENDHQLEIVNEFEERGYLLKATTQKELEQALTNIKDFKPKKYKSNNYKIIKTIENFIDSI